MNNVPHGLQTNTGELREGEDTGAVREKGEGALLRWRQLPSSPGTTVSPSDRNTNVPTIYRTSGADCKTSHHTSALFHHNKESGETEANAALPAVSYQLTLSHQESSHERGHRSISPEPRHCLGLLMKQDSCPETRSGRKLPCCFAAWAASPMVAHREAPARLVPATA